MMRQSSYYPFHNGIYDLTKASYVRDKLRSAIYVFSGLCVCVAAGGAALTGSSPRIAIVTAARAPFVALAREDSQALCTAFTSAAAKHLASERPTGTSCVTRVSEVFSIARSHESRQLAKSLLAAIDIDHVARHGQWSRVIFLFRDKGRVDRYTLRLKRTTDGRWQIVTRPTLAVIRCGSEPLITSCHNGERLVFFVGSPIIPEPPAITPPAAVRSAGAKELREFEAGARVAVESGCLACHRIADQGNIGPGPALTHVGSRLTEVQIAHALVDSRSPMPSFKHLPRVKFRGLVRLLVLLR
jgi:Cytochrome c